jgi:small multidrug resistance pump
MRPWLLLAGAIVLEIGGTSALKLSDGLSRLAPSLAVLVLYAGSFACLALALRRIELGVAYAVWSGIGTAAIALIGILVFKESASALKLVSLALVIAGVVGLNLAEAKP